MSDGNSKRVTVWVQHYADRPYLLLQWVDPETGKRKSRSAGTADEKVAEGKRVDLEADLNAGRYAEASRLTWEGFRELFEDQYVAGLREATRKVYANVFNLFERLCHPRQLRSVTEQTASAFAAALRKEPGNGGGTMQTSTIKVRLQFLHTALQWAADQGLLSRCPKFPSVKVPKKKPQPVAAEAFERLAGKAPDDTMRAFLMAGWLAGLRLGEALELEWEETQGAPYLDFARRRIILPAEFVKAVEDQWLPLDPQLAEVLQALPRHGKKVFCFVSRETKGPLSRSALSCRIRALARAAGVKLTMKTLRRGFGCRYAGKVPAQVLQKLMRHSNIAITMDYYANVDAAVEEAVLGPQHNTAHNTTPGAAGPAVEGDDARAGLDSVNGE
jgi:integrase